MTNHDYRIFSLADNSVSLKYQVLKFRANGRLPGAHLASFKDLREAQRYREFLLSQNKTLDSVCNRAAELLPLGWAIEISLEKGSGSLTLLDPIYRATEVPSDEMTIEDQIREAIRIANQINDQFTKIQ